MPLLGKNAGFLALLTILALVSGAVVATVSAGSPHEHGRSQPCVGCHLAHLPAVQSTIVAYGAPLECVTSEGPRARHVSFADGINRTTSPRAPPVSILA